MLSFRSYHVNLYEKAVAVDRWIRGCPSDMTYITLASTDSSRTTFDDWVKCSERFLATAVYDHSLVLTYYFPHHPRNYYYPDPEPMYRNKGPGFRMLYSFHHLAKAPHKLASGKWNCSVQHYPKFYRHLHCNLEPECEGGEDEGRPCGEYYDSSGCNGSVAASDKCFAPIVIDYTINKWQEAKHKCESQGGSLPTLKTKKDWKAFYSISLLGKRVVPVAVGVLALKANYTHAYYINKFKWIGGGLVYKQYVLDIRAQTNSEPCAIFAHRVRKSYITFVDCDKLYLGNYFCQFSTYVSDSPEMILPMIDSFNVENISHLPLVLCPKGHMTIDFLRCDIESSCGASTYMPFCEFDTRFTGNIGSANVDGQFARASGVDQFACATGTRTVPYSLVCDFRQDCVDGSDETFCVREEHCPGFRCRNKQCIPYNSLCDFYTDCIDGSDEDRNTCRGYHFTYQNSTLHVPDRSAEFPFLYLDNKILGACEYTHFNCHMHQRHCLPVYLRCNFIDDCAAGVDEAKCDNYTCKGYYRCYSSAVCVHPSQLCDGMAQCPWRDDELFCDIHCPSQCQCQGLAFVCPRIFNASAYPTIRYLNATGSGLSLRHLTANIRLVWLQLRNCGLGDVDSTDLPNLQHLDLANNNIRQLNVIVVLALDNLRVLVLSGNPLTSVLAKGINSSQFNLIHFDISLTQLPILNTSFLKWLPNIETLNVSHSALKSISDTGFRYIPLLSILDMSGSPVEDFPLGVFDGLDQLHSVYTDNYKLCCRPLLPDYLDRQRCVAPEDELSSCEDLLRSDNYRAALWTSAVLAVVGNGLCFVVRIVLHRSASMTSFNMFVSNLSMSDFIMGVYLALVGMADSKYTGTYVLFEDTWKESTACKVAGFLSVLSGEVSAFTICLITLDRCIVLRFPFTAIRFGRCSAGVACVLAWLVGLLIAAVPLLPWTAHWNFYSQTGICIPLPVTRKVYPGRGYAYGVIVFLNCILFVFITLGQAFIYLSVKASLLLGKTTRKSRDLIIARRLISVAVTDFLCWFPIGLLALLASMGVPISAEISAIMAIFVLPLNSALNPFLYTFNRLLERRRIAQEQQLMAYIKARLGQQQMVVVQTWKMCYVAPA